MKTCRIGASTTVKKFEEVTIRAAAHHLGDGDDRDQRRVLVQRDQLRDRRRDHAPQALRQDHVAQRLAVGHAQRGGRLALALRQREDAGAHDLGQHGAVVEDQPEQRAQHQARTGTPRAPTTGIASSHASLPRAPAAPARSRGSGRSAAGCGRGRSTRPRAMLTGRTRDSRSSASASPKISAKTIETSAISRLIRKPSRMKRTLLPVVSHSQLSGSKR